MSPPGPRGGPNSPTRSSLQADGFGRSGTGERADGVDERTGATGPARNPTAPTGDGDRPRSGRARRTLTVVVGVVVLVAALLAGFAVGRSRTADANACPVTTVAGRVLPSIVTITARRGPATSTGSGEVIRSDGFILTNNHVISTAAGGGTVQVLFSDGTTLPASITGRDPRTDLAVIKVDAGRPLPVIPIGDSTGVQVGQPVVVLGAPLGLASSVTSGIASALDRTIEVPADNGQTALILSGIQTDAAINPGNSGGAMTDCSGDLIGIPTTGATVPNESGQASAGSVGLGFAIPVGFATSVADEIIATGTVRHSAFGISVARIPPGVAASSGSPEGLFVQAVTPGGPAADAGLQAGDVITAIDGVPATDPNQLAAITLTKRPGDVVRLSYERGKRSAEASVTLGAKP